jgi:hypothetical protein
MANADCVAKVWRSSMTSGANAPGVFLLTVRPPISSSVFHAEDHRVVRSTEPGGVLGDGLHDRLEIGRRARDHPQDLPGRGLLLQRLGQLTIPGIELGEQPHVLDGDHRLGGKRPHQFDVPRRELSRGARDREHPNRTALVQHRNREQRPKADHQR